MSGYGTRVVFEVLGIQITETVTVTWFLMAVIISLALYSTRKLEKIPTGAQNIAEMVVDALRGLVKQTMGEKLVYFTPYIGTLFIFIGLANISGIFGLRPPTADINTTFALSVMTFFIIHATGIYNKKMGYIKGYFEPMAFLFPINLIGEIATPISMGFRLFGNIVGGMIIMSLVYGSMGYFALVPVPAVLHIYFDLFAGLLQSFIFCMLTMVFVSGSFE